MNPPSDGDDIARVTPLRRRDPHLVAVPVVRDPLPAETSVWDTGELGDAELRRSRRRQIRAALTSGSEALRSRTAIVRVRLALGVGGVLACVGAVTAFAVSHGSTPRSRPHRSVAAASVAHAPSIATVLRVPAEHPDRHHVRHRGRAAGRPRRAIADAHRAAPRRWTGHSASAAKTAPAAITTTTSPALSPPVTPVVAASPQASEASSNTREQTRSGPTGSGAAFGPGY